jgi:hypothetical protein
VTIDKHKLTQTTMYTFALHSKRHAAFMDAFNDLLARDDVQYGQLVPPEQQDTSGVPMARS